MRRAFPRTKLEMAESVFVYPQKRAFLFTYRKGNVTHKPRRHDATESIATRFCYSSLDVASHAVVFSGGGGGGKKNFYKKMWRSFLKPFSKFFNYYKKE